MKDKNGKDLTTLDRVRVTTSAEDTEAGFAGFVGFIRKFDAAGECALVDDVAGDAMAWCGPAELELLS